MCRSVKLLKMKNHPGLMKTRMTVWAEILYPGGTQRKHKEPEYPVVKFSFGFLFQKSIPTPLPRAAARKQADFPGNLRLVAVSTVVLAVQREGGDRNYVFLRLYVCTRLSNMKSNLLILFPSRAWAGCFHKTRWVGVKRHAFTAPVPGAGCPRSRRRQGCLLAPAHVLVHGRRLLAVPSGEKGRQSSVGPRIRP